MSPRWIITVALFVLSTATQALEPSSRVLLSGGEKETLSIVVYLDGHPWMENNPAASCQGAELRILVEDATGTVASKVIPVVLDATNRFARFDVSLEEFGSTALLVSKRMVNRQGDCNALFFASLRSPDGSTAAAAVATMEGVRAAMANYAADSSN